MFNINLSHHWRQAFSDLAMVINQRLDQFLDDGSHQQPEVIIDVPDLKFLSHTFTRDEYLILMIALTPHIQPGFFDHVIQQKFPQGGDFPQLGGVRGKQFRGFLPTGETALFILAGEDLQKRLEVGKMFNENHFFARHRILWLEDPPSGEPRMSGRLVLSADAFDMLIHGQLSHPKFGVQFPATRIETELEWKDLILSDQTMAQLRDLENWIRHGDTLLYDWNMKDRIKPGYKVLFYGPPGTGKTLAASLLGKYTGKDVYKVDLSMVVSKYIGETEKNIANILSRAENHESILFFDEADALFGKRTNVRDAHDKYANQEVSYLLQRVETYKGMVILASNFRENIDEAFVRRFQSIIYFAKPRKNERLKIWQNTFPSQLRFDKSVQLEKTAEQYELTGANIVNIVQQICLIALSENRLTIGDQDLKEGIRREYAKEEKML